MFVHSFFAYLNNNNETKEELKKYFFTPYADPADMTCTFFSFIDGFFIDTCCSFPIALSYLGSTFVCLLSAVGNFLILNLANARQDMLETGFNLVIIPSVIIIGLMAPFLEFARFFTRWGSTLDAKCRLAEEDVEQRNSPNPNSI